MLPSHQTGRESPVSPAPGPAQSKPGKMQRGNKATAGSSNRGVRKITCHTSASLNVGAAGMAEIPMGARTVISFAFNSVVVLLAAPTKGPMGDQRHQPRENFVQGKQQENTQSRHGRVLFTILLQVRCIRRIFVIRDRVCSLLHLSRGNRPHNGWQS
jgi:hypothetical protein